MKKDQLIHVMLFFLFAVVLAVQIILNRLAECRASVGLSDLTESRDWHYWAPGTEPELSCVCANWQVDSQSTIEPICIPSGQDHSDSVISGKIISDTRLAELRQAEKESGCWRKQLWHDDADITYERWQMLRGNLYDE